MNRWININKCEAIVVGNPWLNRFKINTSDNDIVNTYVRPISLILIMKKKNILVTLGWGFYGLYGAILPKSLHKFLSEKIDDFNWFIYILIM